MKTDESCVRKPVVAAGWGGKKKQEALIAGCVGKTYEECITARGKPMSKRYDLPFSYTGNLTLVYRWSKGKWEFEREDPEKPKEPATSRT